jgi:spoIIIJ-associated protein
MKEVVGNGRTVDEAKMNALRELGLDSEENVEIEVLDEGSKGVFGWGTKYARVKVRLVGEPGKKSSTAGKKSEPRRSGREKAEMPPITVGERPLPVPPPRERKAQTEEEKEERPERSPRSEKPERFKKPDRHRKPERFNKPEEKFEKEDEFEYESPAVDSYEEIGPELLEEEEGTGPFAPREIIRNLMNYMNVQGEIKIRNTRSGPVYSIEGDNLGVMIGKHGQTLESIQFLVNLILLRKTDRKNKITLDVEGYRSRREKSLQDLAKRLADKAKREKRNIVLEPMLPSERRIIHLTLQDNPSISTFSQGEEPMRKVIISPKKRSNGSEGRRPRNNVEA